jgi:hypothetical protein
MRAGYYWPMVFKYAHAYFWSYYIFYKSSRRESRCIVPLQQVVVEEIFEKWGFDIIGEINPHSSIQHMYILTTTKYFT